MLSPRSAPRHYVTHFAASGEEALALLGGELEPGVIAMLSDINMPGVDGLEFLSAVKRRFPDLPVMMVTAYGDDERRRRAAENGAAEFFTKPADFDLLKTLLRRLPSPAVNAGEKMHQQAGVKLHRDGMRKAPMGGLLLGDRQDEKPNCLTRECYRVVDR